MSKKYDLSSMNILQEGLCSFYKKSVYLNLKELVLRMLRVFSRSSS